MKEYRLTVEMENQFIRYLIKEEKSSHTVEKYQRDLKKFVQFLGGLHLNGAGSFSLQARGLDAG